MIHITKYLVSIKLHFVCFLIGFLLFLKSATIIQYTIKGRFMSR